LLANARFQEPPFEHGREKEEAAEHPSSVAEGSSIAIDFPEAKSENKAPCCLQVDTWVPEHGYQWSESPRRFLDGPSSTAQDRDAPENPGVIGMYRHFFRIEQGKSMNPANGCGD
jgi:hypothetical protein